MVSLGVALLPFLPSGGGNIIHCLPDLPHIGAGEHITTDCRIQ